MRLLNVETKQLKEFHKRIPSYAILSHTWSDDEALFQDLTRAPEAAHAKAGWKKIEESCRIAAEDGLTWIWVDTCCIDKSSSSELSEAINSMFAFYRDAVICYAYLEDYWTDTEPTAVSEAFEDCKWFTRGWTLQELIAPKEVWFYDAAWKAVGSRSMLSYPIEKSTGISSENLLNFRSCSIAQRMSWASMRRTLREEDRAYCLLGLFDINMPLLYGEGSKAFTRLQMEILRSSDDESIFVWRSQFWNDPTWQSLLLAPLLECFENSKHIIARDIPDNPAGLSSGYTMTNTGLQIQLLLFYKLSDHGDNFDSLPKGTEVLAPLNCFDEQQQCFLALRLCVVSGSMLTVALGLDRLAAPFEPALTLSHPDLRYESRSIVICNAPPLRRELDIWDHRSRHINSISVRHPETVTIKSGLELYTEDEAHRFADMHTPTRPSKMRGSACLYVLGLEHHPDIYLVIREGSKYRSRSILLIRSQGIDSRSALMRKLLNCDPLRYGPGQYAYLAPDSTNGNCFMRADIRPICESIDKSRVVVCIEYPVTSKLFSLVAEKAPSSCLTEEQIQEFHTVSKWVEECFRRGSPSGSDSEQALALHGGLEGREENGSESTSSDTEFEHIKALHHSRKRIKENDFKRSSSDSESEQVQALHASRKRKKEIDPWSSSSDSDSEQARALHDRRKRRKLNGSESAHTDSAFKHYRQNKSMITITNSEPDS